MPITDELRQRLTQTVGVNWEVLNGNVREAGCPQPPYKEPLMYLLYLVPEIPWRQCEKVAIRLLAVGASDEASHLAEGLIKSYMAHKPYRL